jgi:hypothetical protein
MSSNLLSDSKCSTLCRVEQKKLSTHRTSCPCCSSRSHKCDPTNPDPPVTRIRLKFPDNSASSHHYEKYVALIIVVAPGAAQQERRFSAQEARPS